MSELKTSGYCVISRRIIQPACGLIYANAKALIHIGGPPGTATVTPRLRAICWRVMKLAKKLGSLPDEPRPELTFITLRNGFTLAISAQAYRPCNQRIFIFA